MTDIRDLEGVLADHASSAPDPEGMIEATHAGARRFRRRRRVIAGAGVATTIALGVLVPTVVPRLDDHPPAPKAATGPPSSIGPDAPNVRIEITAGSGYYRMTHGAVGSGVLASIRPVGSGSGGSGDVGVYAAGILDEAALSAGEPITVGGHRAYYLPQFRFPAANPKPLRDGGLPQGPPNSVKTTPASEVIAWRDPSGAWVTVTAFDRGRAAVRTLADLVTVRPGSDLRAPYRLGYLPAGLRFEGWYARTEEAAAETDSELAFTAEAGQPRWQATSPVNVMPGLLDVRIMPRSGYLDGHTAEFGAPTSVAGHDTWYRTTSDKGVVVPEGGALFFANVGGCQVTIGVRDNTRIPYAEVLRTFEATEFKDCQDPSTWVAPLP
ncbi:hypothetical protein [Streptomyces sp. SID3343]|uniref:hypothetical protein n=1 Tax=Streptomyces sp. SID3343 TaxID=2690260 RepID=UPI001369B0CE|nr:hypothetical protein [Streptomyces sp. SID3343]MYW00573.1 hypothetical protein [Streptomyces sp. SID3343]